MRIGVCVSAPARGADPASMDMIGLAAGIGYDYVEMSIAPMMGFDEADLTHVKQSLAAAHIECECLNVFFPSGMRLTGDGRDEAAIGEYAARAFARAADIGAAIVVFGSGGARNIPDGYPRELAIGQLARTLQIMSDAAARHGIQIAIEALNRGECNVILSMAEADGLMEAADRPNVKLLFDYYHFMLESDSVETLRDLAGSGKIIHAHFAEPDGRVYPDAVKPEHEAVFGALRSAGYGARVSIEARLRNPGEPRAEMEAGLAAMRAFAASM